MDSPWNVTSRWGKRLLKSGGRNEDVSRRDERRYLLSEEDTDCVNDTEVLVHNGVSRLNNNNFNVARPRKAKEEDVDSDELLVSVPGRPPMRPPTDQCVEAEIQPGDTLASIALRCNVPVAELKRVNRLINDKDLFAKRSVKIPIKPASLLTETFPMSDNRSDSVMNTAAVLDLCGETPRRGASPSNLPLETPAVRRALSLLSRIDDDVRSISQRQDDLQNHQPEIVISGSDFIEIEPNNYDKPSWLDRLNTNKKWIGFYASLIVAAVVVILMLTRYETRVLGHTPAATTTTPTPCGLDLNCQGTHFKS